MFQLPYVTGSLKCSQFFSFPQKIHLHILCADALQMDYESVCEPFIQLNTAFISYVFACFGLFFLVVTWIEVSK